MNEADCRTPFGRAATPNRYPTSRPTWAEIDLAALRHNARILRRQIGDAAILAVVKANAYGHGSVEIARVLQHEVEMFGVASIDEAIQLRDAEITTPILLFSPILPEEADAVVAHDLLPTLFTPEIAVALQNAAQKSDKIVAVHLKIDSGMGRLGVAWKNFAAFARTLIEYSNLRIEGIYTHFACAGVNDEFSAEQLRRFNFALHECGVVWRENEIENPQISSAQIGNSVFENAKEDFVNVENFRDETSNNRNEENEFPRGETAFLNGRAILIHAANSAGALNYANARFNMARFGIALYGVAPDGIAIENASGENARDETSFFDETTRDETERHEIKRDEKTQDETAFGQNASSENARDERASDKNARDEISNSSVLSEGISEAEIPAQSVSQNELEGEEIVSRETLNHEILRARDEKSANRVLDIAANLDLRPVMTLKSRVAHCKEIEAGTPLSYGATWTASRKSRIATIPIGYADGYSRRLSNVAQVLLNGVLCPVVGRVTMDQILVDATDAPHLQIGDDVTLFGVGLPVETVARWSETIPYEILCGIAPRVSRVYHDEIANDEIASRDTEKD